MAYEELPWQETRKWIKTKWYPLAFGTDIDGLTEGKSLLMDGYGVYSLERRMDEDITEDVYPVISQPFTLREAVEICEAHNGMTMKELMEFYNK
jgi:hypothetical protein